MAKRSLVIAATALVAVVVVLFVQLARGHDSDPSPADRSASASSHSRRTGTPSETIAAAHSNDTRAVATNDAARVDRSAVAGDSAATAEPSLSQRDRARSAGESASLAPGRDGGRAIRVRPSAPDGLSASEQAIVREKTMNRSLEQAACRAPDVQTRYHQLAANERTRMRTTCAKYGIVLGD